MKKVGLYLQLKNKLLYLYYLSETYTRIYYVGGLVFIPDPFLFNKNHNSYSYILLKTNFMIIIKDKEKNGQIMIPRVGNISGIDNVAEYITESKLQTNNDILLSKVKYDINQTKTQILNEVNKMINEELGYINNVIEDILA